MYDLDGHGKITKDDIAGIVSTIYESIGKTVVVPHYGSKTINVRLTVSPDGKNKVVQKSTTAVGGKKSAIVTPRRRLRPKKLTSEEDEDDDGCESDTSNDSQRKINHNNSSNLPIGIVKAKQHKVQSTNKLKINQNRISKDSSTTTTTNSTVNPGMTDQGKEELKKSSPSEENIYETINNFKYNCPKTINNLHVVFSDTTKLLTTKNCCTAQQSHQQSSTADCGATATTTLTTTTAATTVIATPLTETCRDCSTVDAIGQTEVLVGSAHKYNGRKKIMRKSRSRKKVIFNYSKK